MLLNCYPKNRYSCLRDNRTSVVNARPERCGNAIGPVAWIHKESPIRSFRDDVSKRERKKEKGTMIVWIGKSIGGKGCALRVLPERILLLRERLRSATYVQRHLHDDDDDKDDEDYPLFYDRTSPRTSLFQECELLWKRSYKEIAVSLPITRKVARNLALLILGGPLLIREEPNIIKKKRARRK